MLQKIWGIKLVRFVSVGAFNTLFDIVMLNILFFTADLSVVVANLISSAISLTASYFLNHSIVFRSRDKYSLKQLAQFLLVSGVGILGIQSLVIYSVTHLLENHEAFVNNIISTLHLSITAEAFDLNVAKVLAVLAAMTWNFTIYQFVIFKQADDKREDAVLV